MRTKFFSARRFLQIQLLIWLGTCFQGCYHYHVHAPNFDPATEYRKKTAHALFWGLAQKNVLTENCAVTHGMDEVKVSTNLGFAIITVASLGIWCPMTVEWKCAKPCQDEGDL